MKRQVIVIGLDGATFDIIDPLVDEGHLPTIADLVSRGTKGRLSSTIPYATMPAWPSFMTGKNPGKHGVFDFFSIAGGRRHLSTSQDIRAKTLWEILSGAGKRSIVMNVPGTYPPARINGVVVSGMLTPADAEFASPPDVKGFLDQATDGYRINSRSHLSGRKLVDDVLEVTEKQKRGFVALLRREDWDCAMVMFRATDVIPHHFWQKQNLIRECYHYIDAFVGEIVSAFPYAAIFLISDHGLQAQPSDFHINKWLIDDGYMSIKIGHASQVSRWEEIGGLEGRAQLAESHLRPSNAFRVLLRMGFTGRSLRKVMPRAWWNALKRSVPRSIKDHIPATDDAAYDVDWDHTLASAYQLYTRESKAIKIVNLDQRSREGVCAELVEKLGSLRDPQTGGPIVRRAYRREELYEGPYVDQAPDIILDLHDGYNLTNAFFADDYVTSRDEVRGCHHREGIFLACGDDIERGKGLGYHPSLLDVMPTVLHYLESPVPDDCDGRVLKEILESGSEPHLREVVYEAMDWEGRGGDRSAPYGDDEQAEIEERLRALGYL
ncbi:MAG: hypothetical protein CEE40_11765 [Chloroflexi bacterium B3_Chlor]|nr:MAG: hypothetical protein CEE40_11765 [Chloroflexi bacterium B3_Chlor]